MIWSLFRGIYNNITLKSLVFVLEKTDKTFLLEGELIVPG